MSFEREIKTRFKKIRVEVKPEFDSNVLKDSLATFLSARRKTSGLVFKGKVMKIRLVKLAVAAVAIIAVVLFLYPENDTVSGVAWADVLEKTRKVKQVHITAISVPFRWGWQIKPTSISDLYYSSPNTWRGHGFGVVQFFKNGESRLYDTQQKEFILDNNVYTPLGSIRFMETIRNNENFLESILIAFFRNNIPEAVVAPNSSQSYDTGIEVIDFANSRQSLSARVWVMRQSQLPIQIKVNWINAGPMQEFLGVFDYTDPQSEEFFDPNAFAEKAKLVTGPEEDFYEIGRTLTAYGEPEMSAEVPEGLIFEEFDRGSRAWRPCELSADGKFLAYAVWTIDKRWVRERTDVYVLNIDAGKKEKVAQINHGVSELHWQDSKTLLCGESLSPFYYRISLTTGKVSRFELSELTDADVDFVAYKRISPDKKRIAFLGRVKACASDAMQYGLWVLELESREIRLLIGEGLKNLPAWSPDSMKLAIGNKPGYTSEHPLCIVDVTTGEVTDTQIKGAGAAWSPDGNMIAYVTNSHWGSYRHGIPATGRIAVLNLSTGQLSYVSDEGWAKKFDDESRQLHGNIFPRWSADGKWLAYIQYEQFISEAQDTEEESRKVFVAEPSGQTVIEIEDTFDAMSWDKTGHDLLLVEGDHVFRTTPK
jgi:Tol biopolymer transport system component